MFIAESLRIHNVDRGSLMGIVSGMAVGMDTCGNKFASDYRIPLITFPPNYKDYHPREAPLLRNTGMAEYSDSLLLIWRGDSSGSEDIKFKFTELGKPVYEVLLCKR